MEETISLQDLFKTLRKRASLISFMTIIAVALAGIISFSFLTPIYQASTQILVNQTNQENSSLNSQDIQTNLQLINTYNVIIKSSAILTKVIDELDLDESVGSLNGKITVNSAQNSQVVTISVQDEDPAQAVRIANATASVFQAEIVTLMNVDNVNVLAPAEMAEKPSPIKPNPKLNMAIAAVIGLMLGVGIAFLLEYLDTTMKTEQDIEEVLGLPVLGLISPIPDEDLKNATMNIKNRRRRGK
ncbi:YveK family protein [Sporosarcina pasteurii]|uniref:Capsular polysaccharide type 8 biosynthesis protein cap8A n=1 Tax=Sporosarcina pasteurii TaxID=1474 RepID=A0A380BCS9_SPOPA|nr:Wzz/FepE/Etk N-terminal domain-containing protein [Sporosarcina pasteurii]MDS9472221.1 Wzz/FepE/Etk N-terminal domain-containing protein [Sporosarcina pasteurii]QBQ06206.1 capsular biosynthesis protein [Sporosarcina pasteurii]SUI99182.1 Capsular polysaccharide type 8 biosynthesis protein cap8A [Sporosarcina pasteurii]